MGYDLYWFACALATCDPATAAQAIIAEQSIASQHLLDERGISTPGLPPLDTTTPAKGTDVHLRKLDVEGLMKRTAAVAPLSWTVTHDANHESSWQSGQGAISVYWHERYIIATGYGDFGGGLESLYTTLTADGLVCFDPQSNEAC